MSVSSGFFNSQNHDRRYNANEMASIFDGLIGDGIYKSVGDHFQVTQHAGGASMTVDVGSGRAWFNHTWTFNSATLPVELDPSDLVLDRIDAVVIEVNADVNVRDNSIKVIKGTPSSNPVRPAIINTADIHQHALAYIYISAAAEEIVNADITDMIGTQDTPYVLGIVEMASTVANAIYPIGSIYMSTVNRNPTEYFPGTTWVPWGEGQVPVGVKTSDTDFNTVEKTGGAKTHSYTPAGSVSQPTVSGTVSKPTFSGTTASLGHSGGSVGGHTLTVSEMPSHYHSFSYGIPFSTDYTIISINNVPNGNYPLDVASNGAGGGHLYGTNSAGLNGSHNHPFTQPSAHSYTPAGSVSQPTFSGTVSKPTFTGSAGNINSLQPYITCYMWKRTA